MNPFDGPSAQLAQETRDAVIRSLHSRRPILHHLNADTSWLLQLPRPVAATRRGGRYYYNILIDPWLSGGQSDVAKWFSQQWHATKPALGSIAEVEEMAREMEILASGLRLGKERETNGDATGADTETSIDAIAISHEFTDHCHKETLLDVSPDVPVFATTAAAKLISTWNHFRQVSEVQPFTMQDPDWRSRSLPPLPEWLSISRLQAEGDAFYYHSALLIAFNITPTEPAPRRSSATYPNLSSASSSADAAEAIIYTPHGVPYRTVENISHASPPISTLAFLHGMHDIALGSAQQLNLGGHNGLAAQRILRAKYWVGTHDEIKKGGGLVSWFLKRKVITFEQAVQEEREKRWKLMEVQPASKENGRKEEEREDSAVDVNGSGGMEEAGDEWDDVRFEELANGESRILH